MKDGIDISDLVEFLKGFVDEADLLKCIEDILKSFPINTVHNWNNGPYKKVAEGVWVPLKGAALEAHRKQNPDDDPAHAELKVKPNIKAKGKKQLEEPAEGREKKPLLGKDFKKAKIIKKEVLLKVLDMGHFSVISAGPNSEREGSESKKDKYFKHRHAALVENLNDLGVPFFRVQGEYKGRERSIVVLHEDHPFIKELDKSFIVGHGRTPKKTMGKLNTLAVMYNQDSVIHAHSGKAVEMKFTTKHPERKEKRQSMWAKPADSSGRVWTDATGKSEYYTKALHPKAAHTKFSYNFTDFGKPEHDYND
jgi:hypothetical protein